MGEASANSLNVLMKDRLEASPLIKSWLGGVLVARSGERVPKRAVVDAYRAFCAANCYEPTTSSSFGRFVCEVFPETRSWRSRSKQKGSMGEMFYLNLAFADPSPLVSSSATSAATSTSSSTSPSRPVKATTTATTTTATSAQKRARAKPTARIASVEPNESSGPVMASTTAYTSGSASSPLASSSLSSSSSSSLSSPLTRESSPALTRGNSSTSPHEFTSASSSAVSSPISSSSSSSSTACPSSDSSPSSAPSPTSTLPSLSGSLLTSLCATPAAPSHSPHHHHHHHHGQFVPSCGPVFSDVGGTPSSLLWSASLLHADPASSPLRSQLAPLDDERRRQVRTVEQQQRRLAAWLEQDDDATATTATTTTTTATSYRVSEAGYREVATHRNARRPAVNLWTADAELHTLGVLHSFVEVYHHHIWISCPINPGCFDFETLRHICMTDDGRRERSPVSLNIYVALSIGSTYAGDLERGLEFWMIAREHLGYVFDASSYDVACTLRLMARAAHVFSKTEKEGREKAAYYFELAKQIFTAVGSVHDENYIMADKCNALYHTQPPDPDEALNRMMRCNPQPAWRRTWRLTEYQFLQCKYGRVAEGLRDHLWHVFAHLRVALDMLAASEPLATSKLEEVMTRARALEAQFTQELEGEHFTANRHVVAYQRTFILFMKACCAHRLGWTTQALQHTHAFFSHLTTFNPGALAVILSEMWWLAPIASEVAGLLRLCLHHRRQDQLSLFFQLLAPLRGKIVWADRIGRLAEDLLARAALDLPASHFFPYSSFTTPASAFIPPPSLSSLSSTPPRPSERRKRAHDDGQSAVLLDLV